MQPRTMMQTWALKSSFVLLNKCLNGHASLKTISQKEERALQKSWVTNGFKKSINVRDKLYKKMIKQKDATLKNQYQMFYKRYRRKIVDLLKITKKVYYKKYFLENKNKF